MNKMNAFDSSIKKFFNKTEIVNTAFFPKIVYKYREFNEYSLDIIVNHYLYLAPSNKLDDQFDCSINFDEQYFREYSESEILKEYRSFMIDYLKNKLPKKEKKLMQYIDKCVAKDGKIIYENINKYINSNDSLKSRTKINKEKIDQFNKYLEKELNDEGLSKGLTKFFDLFKDYKSKVGICALTTKKDSQIMWQMYAGNYSGFCIEYELDQCFVNCQEKNMAFFPVFYENQFEYDPLKHAVKFLVSSKLEPNKKEIICTNEYKEFVKIFCTKHKEWELQEEWRIVGDPKCKVAMPKIKRIYLGKNISPVNEKGMIKIALENGIELYKQKDNFKKLSFDFEKIDLQ